MSSQSFIAPPLSRNDIRRIARFFRKILGLEDEKTFPIVEVFEWGMPLIDEEFVYDIQPIEKMGTRHGLTYPDQHLIVIREDVYERATRGAGRDRLTIAHEIGHYIMHDPKKLALARTERDDMELPAYLDPEWQANAFAGELLAPAYIIRGMTPEEVVFKCKVSMDAALKQLKHA